MLLTCTATGFPAASLLHSRGRPHVLHCRTPCHPTGIQTICQRYPFKMTFEYRDLNVRDSWDNDEDDPLDEEFRTCEILFAKKPVPDLYADYWCTIAKDELHGNLNFLTQDPSERSRQLTTRNEWFERKIWERAQIKDLSAQRVGKPDLDTKFSTDYLRTSIDSTRCKFAGSIYLDPAHMYKFYQTIEFQQQALHYARCLRITLPALEDLHEDQRFCFVIWLQDQRIGYRSSTLSFPHHEAGFLSELWHIW